MRVWREIDCYTERDCFGEGDMTKVMVLLERKTSMLQPKTKLRGASESRLRLASSGVHGWELKSMAMLSFRSVSQYPRFRIW